MMYAQPEYRSSNAYKPRLPLGRDRISLRDKLKLHDFGDCKLVNPTAASTQRSMVAPLQLVPWQAGDETAIANLTPALREGYQLAHANPEVKPARPAWVLARVMQANPWNAVAVRQATDAQALTEWNNKPQNVRDQLGPGWLQARSNLYYNARHNAFLAQREADADHRWLHANWNVVFDNAENNLPADGNYREYYAQPTGDPQIEGFWGRNRIIRNVDTGDWFATNDHYESFTKVV